PSSSEFRCRSSHRELYAFGHGERCRWVRSTLHFRLHHYPRTFFLPVFGFRVPPDRGIEIWVASARVVPSSPGSKLPERSISRLKPESTKNCSLPAPIGRPGLRN